MLKIKTLRQTCDACPTQWEGSTDDGRMVYVRYRWGYLSVRISERPTQDVVDAVMGEEIFGAQLGDGLDGRLEYEDLRQTAPELIQWPEPS